LFKRRVAVLIVGGTLLGHKKFLVMLLTYRKSPFSTVRLVSLIPIFATSYFHQQRNVQFHAVFH
jgi:hypothetical protein